MSKTVKIKLVPYKKLDSKFTQVPDCMSDIIKNHYTFRVYYYLCRRYNSNYDYAFPTFEDIAQNCHMSLRKAKDCVKWLVDNKYIVKKKFNNGSGFLNNIYYIRYAHIDKDELVEAIDVEEEMELEIEELEIEI